jgi:hypothetical protein
VPRIELGLFENAIDSLNEALSKYQEGISGNDKAYKFCVQHLSHFLELVLKYYVTQSHPLLIYKNPFSKQINEESQTIGLFEAINFLKNEGHQIPEKFECDLKWLKKLRNNIEHHKFSMKAEEVKETVGRLMSAVVVFDELHKNIDLSAHISEEQYSLFHELANTYERRLIKAEEIVEAFLAGCDPKDDCCSVYHCYECDHDTMIPEETSSTGYQCTFCENEESDDIEVNCGMCDQKWPVGEMTLLDWSDSGHYEYYCPYCLHDPEYRTDD